MTKNQELDIHFFMREATKDGRLVKGSVTKDLEQDFEGLIYGEANGLLDKGKMKNIYSESYSDSDRLRVHFPDNPTRENTKVTFTFYFTGENRQAVFESFYEYVTGGIRAFWDTERNRYLVFYAPNEYAAAKEVWYGSKPYLQLKLEVDNLFGSTFASLQETT